MPLTSGTSLGPYQIEAPLGAGGMGEVYKARDTRLDRTVAIKVLPEHVAADPDLKQRFEREARTVAALNHPHICTLHDIGSQDGVDFLVMEYLDGETLAQRLEKGALPLDQALQIAIEIADALDKAHRQGIVHRDLKPGNIMLTKSGAKLLDFGLAKLKQAGAVPADFSASPTQSAGLTAIGTILGTLQHMAPEQLAGEEADVRSDVFALGTVIYEMVSGRKAFEGKSQATLAGAILHVDPPSLSSLQPMTSPTLDHLVKTCLAKEPDDRCQTAGEVGRQLKWIVEGGSESSVAASIATAPQPANWGRAVLFMAAVAAIVVIAGTAGWFLKPSPPRHVGRFVVLTPPGGGLFLSPLSPEVAISPDGTRIVYASGLGPRSTRQLYLRHVDQLDAVPLRGTEGANYPFFSADGESIGFKDGNNDLKRVPVLGGPAATITPIGGVTRGVSWGPDDTIVFSSETSNGLRRVPSVGGDPEVLTTTDREGSETIHAWPDVLPNNKGVLFTAWSGSSESSRIAVVSLETKNVTYLLTGGSSPRYSPTGHLVYAEGGTLWAVGFDPDQLELTSRNPVPVVENVNTKDLGAADFGIANSGSLVYVSGSGRAGIQRRLVWVDREGREDPLALDPGGYRLARVSPDGTRVAVAMSGPEGTEVWTSDVARGTRSILTPEPGIDERPLWTPDGERVVFRSILEGTEALSWKAADGSDAVEPLLTVEDARRIRSFTPYDWSPDGNELIFEYISPTSRDIGVLSMEGERPWQPLLNSAANENAPALSPDGRWLAYRSDETGQSEVYVDQFPDLGNKEQISTGGGQDPVWSSDGSELFFLDAEGGSRMMVVPIDTEPTLTAGTATVLFEGNYYHALPRRLYDVAPDGRFLMIKPPDGAAEDTASVSGQIVVVEGWFEELKRLVPIP